MTIKPLGFSLIELMIAIAIIATIASIAAPAYNAYLMRAKISELMQMSGPFQNSVAECYFNKGVVIGCNSNTNGIPESTIATYGVITTTDGNITLTLNESDSTSNTVQQVMLIPRTSGVGNPVTWDCGGNIDKSYLPSSCTVFASATTTNSYDSSAAQRALTALGITRISAADLVAAYQNCLKYNGAPLLYSSGDVGCTRKENIATQYNNVNCNSDQIVTVVGGSIACH